MSVYQRYAHIFWMPFFPTGMTGVSVCNHCRQMLNTNVMPPELGFRYENFARQTQTPFWSYAGLGIVALIVVGSTVNRKHTGKKINEYVQAPKAGDVLQVKMDEDVYTLYKINRVNKDSVFIVTANYQSDQEEDLKKIGGKGFDPVENGLSRSDLIDMNKDKKILDIERN